PGGAESQDALSAQRLGGCRPPGDHLGDEALREASRYRAIESGRMIPKSAGLDSGIPMTTIVSVRRGDKVALGGDGQVTLGNTVVKSSARKVRRLHDGKVLAGFAGGTADAFTLFERFEAKLEKYPANLMRAAVELAKDWRTDRMLRR